MARPKSSRPPHRSPAKAPEQKTGRGDGPKTYDNTNTGVLFPNDKDGNEARPDFTGKIFVVVPEGKKAGDVVELRLAGWEKEAKSSGNKFLSLRISEPKPFKSE